MKEPASIGVAKARRIGNGFAALGLLAGGLGLFAGGLLAALGTVASVCCVAAVCVAKMAEQSEQHHDRLVEGWPQPPPAEAETLSITQEVSITTPEKTWVASLDTPRQAGHRR